MLIYLYKILCINVILFWVCGRVAVNLTVHGGQFIILICCKMILIHIPRLVPVCRYIAIQESSVSVAQRFTSVKYNCTPILYHIVVPLLNHVDKAPHH